MLDNYDFEELIIWRHNTIIVPKSWSFSINELTSLPYIDLYSMAYVSCIDIIIYGDLKCKLEFELYFYALHLGGLYYYFTTKKPFCRSGDWLLPMYNIYGL